MNVTILKSGTFPSENQFFVHCDKLKIHAFLFLNDSRMGTCSLSPEEIFSELKIAEEELIAFDSAPHFNSRKFAEVYDWAKEILNRVNFIWQDRS